MSFTDRRIDLAVLGQDPRFGGGGREQTRVFLDGAAALGRHPELVYVPHPGLDDRRGLVHRVEAVHQFRAGRRLAERIRGARSVWVAATMAANGAAAPRSGRPYAVWLGTTIDSEWAGRGPWLPQLHRIAAGASLPALRRIERNVLRGAARLHATSAASRAAVAAAANVALDDVGLLPIPIELEHFTPEPLDAWRHSLELPTLAFVGRADDPRKNVTLLLQAVNLLPGVRLRLIGDPPRGFLPERVEATGRVPDVAAALRGATLFVLPSRQEGFAIVAAEALAAGLPVVTTPSGGPEDLILRSGGGVVLDSFRPEELAAVVESLLANEDRLTRMRAAGRAFVEREHSMTIFRERLSIALAEADQA